ncbi:MAG: hypothetical protein ACXAEF_10105, partial [Candidatus Thorarchaeota archaeon]
MTTQIDKIFLGINIGLYIASILCLVYASFNGLWILSIVVPIPAIHLVFNLRSNYQGLQRFYQEYLPSFSMNVFNIVLNLFLFTAFLIGVFYGYTDFFSSLGMLLLAVIA